MITISEWNQRYEVNSRGLEAKEGDELRVGPLKWIRLKVHGHEQGTGYRRLKTLAGKKTMEVFGLFCKFLEIAGNQPKCSRGKLLNEHDEPATPQDLAFILDVPVGQISNAIKVLSDKAVGWLACNTENITQLNTTQYNTIQGAGDLQKSPENPGKFIKPTVKEVTKYAKTIGYELDGQAFCDYYESNGWRVGRNPMKSWHGAVGSWKAKDYGRTNNRTTQPNTGHRSAAGGGDNKFDGEKTDWAAEARKHEQQS